jgi:hypothetical protein
MKTNIQDLVESYSAFQRNKRETMKIPGELQALPIRIQIWTNISMDSIVGLPKSSNKSIIVVIIYHLSKVSHFCALSHPLTHS